MHDYSEASLIMFNKTYLLPQKLYIGLQNKEDNDRVETIKSSARI